MITYVTSSIFSSLNIENVYIKVYKYINSDTNKNITFLQISMFS